MNAKANALGLGWLFSTSIGICFILLLGAGNHPIVAGLAIGGGCSLLYMVGMLVGRADERSRATKAPATMIATNPAAMMITANPHQRILSLEKEQKQLQEEWTQLKKQWAVIEKVNDQFFS